MLELKKVCAKVKSNDLEILNDFSLKINDGEIHVIMGPNGTGKSTLSKVIMGHYQYEVTSGDILYDKKSILDLEVSERAKLGLFLCMQDPTVIEGVSNSEFLRTARSSITGSMLHRSLNQGFSGGEKKKNEVLQLKVLKPKFIILDELDSGLDVDSLKVACLNINAYLQDNPKVSVLIITHYPRVLEYIKPDYVHILNNGKIVKTGDINLAFEVEKAGYEEYE